MFCRVSLIMKFLLDFSCYVIFFCHDIIFSLYCASPNVTLPANRAVEVNEMWQLRQKELELDNRLRGTRNESKGGSGRGISNPSGSTSRECYNNESHASASCSTKKRARRESHPIKDDGLRDDEIEEFLHARYPSPKHFLVLCLCASVPVNLCTRSARLHYIFKSYWTIFWMIGSREAGVLLDQGWMKMVHTFRLVQIPSKKSQNTTMQSLGKTIFC